MSWSTNCEISRPGENWTIACGSTSFSCVCRKRAEIPVYSFEKHARVDRTTAIYSPHVIVLEGIFALYDPRVLELLDMKVPGSGSCVPLRD
jgi:hypothetical protein